MVGIVYHSNHRRQLEQSVSLLLSGNGLEKGHRRTTNYYNRLDFRGRVRLPARQYDKHQTYFIRALTFAREAGQTSRNTDSTRMTNILWRGRAIAIKRTLPG